MALPTAASIKATNHEFERCPDALLEDRIARAVRSCSAEEYGDQYEDAVASLAMHLVAISPWGQTARMVNKEGLSTYYAEFRRIMESRVDRSMVAGVPGRYPSNYE